MQLKGEHIEKIVYIKPNFVDIYTTESNEPIQYFLKDNRFTPQRFYIKNNGVSELPFWRKSHYDIFENNEIHAMLKYLEEKDLWTETKNNMFTYINPYSFSNNTSKPARNNTRSSIYNKNGNKLPVGWHRISKNGKNSFKGPKNNQIYKNVTRHNNNRTYKVKEGNDTFYILKDGTLSWTPFKVPAA